MSISAGPTRLVLINSGKFSYGEVDLTVPLHLVGPNNVGKTTLISTLQYLYIDDQRQMSFSRDLDETRKYYFPSQNSYVLFECLTPTGYMVVGAAGLGVLKGHDFQRFLYRGTYDMADFLTPDGHVREAGDIRKDLGLKDYVELTPGALQSALTGIGPKQGANLGLVPVRNRDGYAKFRTIFKNLLRLSHLTQQDMKTFLIEVHRTELRRTEIDLAGDFAQEYRRVEQSARELADLRANSRTAADLLKLDDERQALRRELPVIRSAIISLGERRIEELRVSLVEIERELAEIKLQKHNIETARQSNLDSLSDLNKRMGVSEERLRSLEAESERFASYLGDMEKGRLTEKEENLTRIRMLLIDADRENPDQVRTRKRSCERQLESVRRKLANIERSAAVKWGELPRDSGILFRVFNEDIMSLPEGPEGIIISDHDAAERMLRGVSERVSDGIYTDEAFRLNLLALDPPDLHQLADRPGLEQSIASLEATVARDTATLEASERRLELERTATSHMDELEAGRRIQSDWERFEQDRKAATGWSEELSRLRDEGEAAEGKLKSIEKEAEELRKRETAAAARKDSCSRERASLGARLEGLPSIPGTWQGVSFDIGDDLEAMFHLFELKYRKEGSNSERIADMMRSLEANTYGKYRASDESAALQSIREDLDALDGKEEAVRKLWTALATSLGEAFKGLLDSLETLEVKIAELNRRLSSVPISDLAKLTLKIGEVSAKISPIRQQVLDDEMPLFSDRSAVDQALTELGELLQTSSGGRIELQDLFNISFEVQTSDGRAKVFSRLENIESHGTTIAIKVLVNLMLLRGLISNQEVRIPFYLDEASSLDRGNLMSVVKTAFNLGFPAILASPDAMDVAENIYYVKDVAGRVHLDPEQSRIHLDRDYSTGSMELDGSEHG